MFDEALDPLHRVPVVGVCLVPLELRELGLVLVGDALVPEVLAELVDLVEAADDEALEVQLVGDPEEVVLVEVVVVGDERLGEPASVARLEDRRLDLDEALRVEPASGLRDDPRSRERQFTRPSLVRRSR